MTWDGNGIDPWLPQRLAHETRIVETERRMYNSWWASFSAWIVRVNRAVLSGPAPDAHAVWAYAPLWAEHMARFVAGPVTDAVRLAYDALFGKGYQFDSRPAVTRHLAEVTNRMVRTPEEVFNVVAGEVAKGAGQGESIPDIAARVDNVLSTTGNENWHGRAVTVARTETLSSLNAGRADAFAAVAEALDEDLEHQWISTLDLRCRLWHLEADEQRVPLGTPFLVGGEPLMQPGDPTGSPSNIINCRCSTVLVRPDESVDMTGRGFSDADDWWASQVDDATASASAQPAIPWLDRFDDRANAASTGQAALSAVQAALDRKPRDGVTLTSSQRSALRTYESAAGAGMNNTLRRGALDDADSLYTRRNVNRIDEVMAQSRLTAEIQVWRGIQNAGLLFGGRLDNNLTGFEWRELAYASTSADVRIAESFTYPGTDGPKVLMRLLVPQGTGALRMSGMGHGGAGGPQAELLLERGLRMHVVADRGVVNGVRQLDVEVRPA